MEREDSMEVIDDSDITPQNVAEFFLTKSALSPKKIQKLVYYAYAWFIALNNDDVDDVTNVLFEEAPEAWIHGPVFSTLYDTYRSNGWHEVDQINKSITFKNSNVQNLLEDIWDKFGRFQADELEMMTHREDPWIKARAGSSPTQASRNKISRRDIFLYYNAL